MEMGLSQTPETTFLKVGATAPNTVASDTLLVILIGVRYCEKARGEFSLPLSDRPTIKT